ncbi:Orn/Lys/Arg decarboxylase N-terminal domain-containing protein [Taklimakanibacter lacteus]|uniref:Orn/Lys/Arg family decarboxylase n=1 Tax=Taklimakanibacter lacteus TaxID=2268456 RepID=UPI000E669911
MLERTIKLQKHEVLIIDEELALPKSLGGRAVRALAQELTSRDIEVIEAVSFADGRSVIISDASIDAILIDWTRERKDARSRAEALDLLRTIRSRNAIVPIMLMADQASREGLTVEVMQLSDEYVWLHADTIPFIASRIMAAIQRYQRNILPPFTNALLNHVNQAEYSWAAPGHQGGVAFTKTPAGRVFFEFFGENLFRADTGIERDGLGSLLEHSGPIGEAEAYAARVFGAHRSYSGLTGTSGSNRAVIAAAVGDGQFALCDRNCHKSIEQGLIQSGGIPAFLVPTRNRYGIIGPILPEEFDPKAIRRKLDTHPLKQHAVKKDAVYAVVTNSTYDGLCYDSEQVENLLGKSVDRIHLDEAWYGYARFNPIYAKRFAMRGDPKSHKASDPTVFSTQSTHKLLAALSQSSYIHVRDGRNAIEHSRFNESYMAQATTSPLYSLIASNEIGASMMDGPSGKALTDEVIEEAITFRQTLARAQREFANKKDWFFSPWNAPKVKDRKAAKKVDFADADPRQLATDPDCWVLHPGETWHGFDGLPDGWCMLDPIKVGIVCPGMGDDGEMQGKGIPAPILSDYLHHFGIIPSRTTDFMVLCLFSIGITKGKWGTLMSVLLDFKDDYDANRPLAQCLPDLMATAPQTYAGMGLRDLADKMFMHMKANRMGHLQAQAFCNLPKPVMLPRRANGMLMAGEAELLPVGKLANRVAGVGIIPYPPGIPIVLPGESFGPSDGPWLSYIRALQDWGKEFPGFEKEVEGTVVVEGEYQAWAIKE